MKDLVAAILIAADGICAYYQAQAVNQNKPHDRKEYIVQIE